MGHLVIGREKELGEYRQKAGTCHLWDGREHILIEEDDQSTLSFELLHPHFSMNIVIYQLVGLAVTSLL